MVRAEAKTKGSGRSNLGRYSQSLADPRQVMPRRHETAGPHSLAHDPHKSTVHGMQDPLTGSKPPDAYST